jgi:hypothetical protein
VAAVPAQAGRRHHSVGKVPGTLAHLGGKVMLVPTFR